MAIAPGLLPNTGAPISDDRGYATQEWRDFFLLLATGADSEELRDEYVALANRVTVLEEAGTKPIYEGTGISVVTTADSTTVTLAAVLPNLLDVDSNLDVLAVEDDALRYNATTELWEARASVTFPAVMARISLGF